MAIITTQHCDICRKEIPEIPARPGFPQLSWCFFREGLQNFIDPSGKPMSQSTWQGKVNRMEFCQEHGQQLNSLLKAFTSSDSKLSELLSNLSLADKVKWNSKQGEIKMEFYNALAAYEKRTEAKT